MFTKHLKRIVFISIGLLCLLFWLLRTLPQQHRQTIKTTQTVDTQEPVPARHLPQAWTGKKTTSADERETDFYRTIVDNNLFRPLGWRPPRPREPYRLLGTIVPTNENRPKQAILQRTTARTTHIATIGEKLDADTTLIDIQPKQVTLETSGQQRTLRLNTAP